MGQWAVLKITDGTTSVNLLGAGLRLLEWLPAIAEAKNGGVWKDSPLADGRKLTFRRFGNVIETFKLAVSDGSQEAVITDTQNLRRLLEAAIEYWLDKAGVVDPVWIEARASCETNSRYALIYDYRTPADGDPYNGSFVSSVPPFAFDEWQLLIERGHWLSSAPNVTPTCLPLNSSQNGFTYDWNLIVNFSFETAGGGGADVFGNWTETAGDGAIVQDAVSPYHLTQSAKLTAGALHNTQILQDVVVTASTLYSLCFYEKTSLVTNPGYYRVIDNTHGGADIIASTQLPIDTVRTTTGWYKYGTSFTTPAGCISIGVILQCSDQAGTVVNYDYVVLRKMVTQIYGKSSSCLLETFTANKSSKGQITNIHYYDASTAGYSGNLALSAPTFDLFPNPMAVGDMCYFGIDDGALYSGPFSSLVFCLLQSGGGTLSGVWEYWNGAWVALTTIDMTYSLTASSTVGVAFEPPADWAKTNVTAIALQDVYGYWIRFRVTGLGAGVPRPRQQLRRLYTVNYPQVFLTYSDIYGDIPALAKFAVHGLADSSNVSMAELILFTRSVLKGNRFNPFINLTDITQDSEISLVLTSSAIAPYLDFTNAIDAPTGRALWFHPAGANSAWLVMTILNPLCNHYFGTFRAYLRVKQTGGAARDVYIDLSIDTTGGGETHRVYNTVLGAQTMLDFGTYTFPTTPLAVREKLASININIRAYSANAAGANVLLYDVIFIPVDENVVHAIPQGAAAELLEISATQYLALDSTYPKQQVKATVLDNSGYIIRDSAYQTITSRPFTVQPWEDQVVGFIYFDEPGGHLTSLVQAYHQDRYLSMRGNR